MQYVGYSQLEIIKAQETLRKKIIKMKVFAVDHKHQHSKPEITNTKV